MEAIVFISTVLAGTLLRSKEQPYPTGHAPVWALPARTNGAWELHLAPTPLPPRPRAASGSQRILKVAASGAHPTALAVARTPFTVARIPFAFDGTAAYAAHAQLAVAHTPLAVEAAALALVHTPQALAGTPSATAPTARAAKTLNRSLHPLAERAGGTSASIRCRALRFARTPLVPKGSPRAADGQPSAAQAGKHPISKHPKQLNNN